MNKADTGNSTQRSAKVLLVAQNRLQGLVSQRELERSGFVVAVSSDAKGALAMLNQNEFALVLIEPMDPDVQAFELCQQIRGQSQDSSGLSILLRLAAPDTQQILAAIHAGANRVLLGQNTRQNLSEIVASELALNEAVSTCSTPDSPTTDTTSTLRQGDVQSLLDTPDRAIHVLLAGLGDLLVEISSLNAQQLALKQQNYTQKQDDHNRLQQLQRELDQLRIEAANGRQTRAINDDSSNHANLALQTLKNQIQALSSQPLALLVDDEPIARTMAAASLEKLGLKVIHFSGGNEILRWLHEHDERPAMIFMDQLMPDLDGIQATRAIREIDSLRNIPIIGLSGNSDASSVSDCLKAGMNDHLAKTPNPAALYAAVEKWLRAQDMLPGRVSVTEMIHEPPMVSGFDGQLTETSASNAGCQLSGLPMVDYQRAVMVASDPVRFQSLLVAFNDRYTPQVMGWNTDKLVGDKTASLLLAHSIKGAAATLGLSEISVAAAAIESALKADNFTHVDAQLSVLAGHMKTFSRALASLTEVSPVPERGVPEDTDIHAVLGQLFDLTEQDDPKALDWYERYQSAIATFDPELNRQLLTTIPTYDLAGASNILKTAVVRPENHKVEP